MYVIDGYSPTPLGGMGSHGFQIHLSPEFRGMVAKAKVTEEVAYARMKSLGISLGMSTGVDHRHVRLSWGEWGVHSINLGHNCCCLTLSESLCMFPGGRVLVPHNIDGWAQKNFMLGVILDLYAYVGWMTAEGIDRA